MSAPPDRPGPGIAVGAGGPTLNPDALGSLREALADDELLAEIIRTFVDEAPRQLAALVGAQRHGDLPGAAAGAHLIRGGALSLGATRLVSLCAALERSPEEADDLAAALTEELAEVARSLTGYLDELLPRPSGTEG